MLRIKKLFVTVPFQVCVAFLMGLGRCLGLGYKQISVYFNLYLQGFLLLLSGVLPFVASFIHLCQYTTFANGIMTLAFLGYGSIYLAGFIWLIIHYKSTTEYAFEKCVADLLGIAEFWHLSYNMVNLVIFIIWWLSLVGINIFVSLLLF